jgi:hypothetical protein
MIRSKSRRYAYEGKRNKTLRNVLIFSLIAMSCGWVGRLLDLKVGTDENGSVGQLIWIVSPLLTMMSFRAFLGDGWKDLGIKLKFKENFPLYIVSMLFSPFTTIRLVHT